MSDLDPSLLPERIRAQIGGTYFGASFTDSLLTDCANVISALSQELKAARERAEAAEHEIKTLGDLRLLHVLENEILAEAQTESVRLAAHNSLLVSERDAALEEVRKLAAALAHIMEANTPVEARLLAAAALAEPEETK